MGTRTKKQAARLHVKRQARATRMAAPGGRKSKSAYAKKLRRKRGGGTVDPRWMWWLDRGPAVSEKTAA